MCLLVKFGAHRSYENGDIISYISFYTKAELTASILNIHGFSRSEIRFTIPHSRTRLPEKQRQFIFIHLCIFYSIDYFKSILHT